MARAPSRLEIHVYIDCHWWQGDRLQCCPTHNASHFWHPKQLFLTATNHLTSLHTYLTNRRSCACHRTSPWLSDRDPLSRVHEQPTNCTKPWKPALYSRLKFSTAPTLTRSGSQILPPMWLGSHALTYVQGSGEDFVHRTRAGRFAQRIHELSDTRDQPFPVHSAITRGHWSVFWPPLSSRRTTRKYRSSALPYLWMDGHRLMAFPFSPISRRQQPVSSTRSRVNLRSAWYLPKVGQGTYRYDYLPLPFCIWLT